MWRQGQFPIRVAKYTTNKHADNKAYLCQKEKEKNSHSPHRQNGGKQFPLRRVPYILHLGERVRERRRKESLGDILERNKKWVHMGHTLAPSVPELYSLLLAGLPTLLLGISFRNCSPTKFIAGPSCPDQKKMNGTSQKLCQKFMCSAEQTWAPQKRKRAKEQS